MLGQTSSLTDTIERFREDLPLYAQACLIIRDKWQILHHLEMNEAQLLVHKELSKQLREKGRIRAIILKARQEGVSTYVAARFFRRLHLYTGVVAMVIADELLRAGALYDIYNRYLENLPTEIAPVRKTHQSKKLMAFSHDSELVVRPSSDSEAGRAQTIHLLHASELAYWDTNTARETWVSLMQAVPKLGSEVIIESTAKGAGGLFHELWEAAERGEEWLAIFLPWWIHAEYEVDPDDETLARILEDPDDFERQALGEGIPFRGEYHRLSYRKLAWRRWKLVEAFGADPEHPNKDSIRAFQQEYPATAEEAFLVSGACFFDEDQLRIMTRETQEPIIKGRLVKVDDSIVVENNARGFVKIWEAPHKYGHYVIGADTAEGKLIAKRVVSDILKDESGGRDYSTAQVVKLPWKDKNNVQHGFKVVAEIHGRCAPEVFAEQLRLLGQYYSCGRGVEPNSSRNALLAVERSHSSGQTVLRLLREHYKYIPLFWNREINRLTRHTGKRVGWITDATSRMPMLDDLASLVRNGQVEVPSRDLIREMVTFVVWEDGKPAGEEGCHDDRVIAVAIAIQMALREHRHSGGQKMPEYKIDYESQVG